MVQLDENSHVVRAPTVQSSPSNPLNAPATEAAEQSTFSTKSANCQPTTTEYALPIEFNDNNNVQPTIPSPQPQLPLPSGASTQGPAAACRTQQIEAGYLGVTGPPAYIAKYVARHEADGLSVNAIESIFAPIRTRTDAMKRLRTAEFATAVTHALITKLTPSWRRLRGYRELLDLRKEPLALKNAA
jgi:hypothetical protein